MGRTEQSKQQGELKSAVWKTRLPLLLLIAILVVVGVRGTVIITENSESFFNNDEPRHIMNAIFWYDFIRFRPFSDPVGFAHTYYSQYPAIAILHWPPMLYVLTGLIFLGSGPSVVVARFVVLLTTLALYMTVYALARKRLEPWPATIAVLLLGTATIFQDFQTVFMLEIPCMLIMTFTVLTMLNYVSSGKRSHIWLCSACMAATLLTKQHGIVIIPVILCIAIFPSKRRCWRDFHLWMSFAISGLLTTMYYLFVFSKIPSLLILLDLDGNACPALWSFAIKVGPVATIPALAGIMRVVLPSKRNCFHVAMIVWILSVLVLFLTMGVRDSRYLIYALPPMVILAADFLSDIAHYIPRRLRILVPVMLGAMFLWNVGHLRPGVLSGFEKMAIWANRSSETRVVIFGGRRDGTFVLYRRLHDPELRTITLRADKLIGYGKGLPFYDYTVLVESREEVRNLLARLNPGAVILEDLVDYDKPEHRWFWELVPKEYSLDITIPVRDPDGRISALHGYLSRDDSNTRPLLQIPVLTHKGFVLLDPNASLHDYGH